MAPNPLAALRDLTEAVRERSRIKLGREITIATAAYGNGSATRTFLASLFSSVKGDFELILVDDWLETRANNTPELNLLVGTRQKP